MTYDYQCQAPECGCVEEIRHGMNETPLVLCERCGADMRRLISGAGFILKGDNWAGKSIRRFHPRNRVGPKPT